MRVNKILLGLIAIAFVGFLSCSQEETLSAIEVPQDEGFFDDIMAYNLFRVEGQELIINKELKKYEVINALFTDYAQKDRYIYLPNDSKLSLADDGRFVYPTGTIIVKNFYYDAKQLANKRMLETRLLIKGTSEWRAMSYVWNEEQTNANKSDVGDIIPLEINHPSRGKLSFDYVVPNKNQCKGCHNYDERIDPLGLKYANVNKKIVHEGIEVNQIDHLVELGKLNMDSDKRGDLVTMPSYLDTGVPIEQRAKSYLDVNCGHCHREEGPGNTSGLFLQFDENRPNHLGFCKSPVAAGRGSGGFSNDILPGEADSSILVFRMSSLDAGIMMPEVGRSLAHTEGIEIVKEWINSLDYDCKD